MRVSLFACACAKEPVANLCIDQVLSDIRTGKWQKPVEAIRRTYATAKAAGQDPKKAVKAMKNRLPAVTFSGCATRRGNDGIVEHNGILCADIDSIGDRLTDVRQRLLASVHLLALFLSPTGTGLKALFRVPADLEKHSDSFQAVRQHVLELAGVRLDEGCKDVGRLCFVSSDPDLCYNPKATELKLLCQNAGDVAQTHRLPDVQDSQTPMSLIRDGSEAMAWVLDFLPTRPHETNRFFFLMARRALDLELAMGRAFTLQELKVSFDLWFDSANPEFLSESRDDYFLEFCRIRGYAKKGLNQQPLMVAWERANTQPPPAIAATFENAKVRLLIALCFHLQVFAGQSSFFLSSHDVARLLQLNPALAHRMLRTLEGARILTCTKRGDPKARRASEYAFQSSNA